MFGDVECDRRNRAFGVVYTLAAIHCIYGKTGVAMRTVLMFAGLSTVLCTLTRTVLGELGCNKACLELGITGYIPPRNLVKCSCKLCSLGPSRNIAPFIELPQPWRSLQQGHPGFIRFLLRVFITLGAKLPH
jgi:hypothetical protein